MENVTIRPICKEDYDFVLKVNADNVEVLSPMDRDKLVLFTDMAELLLVAEMGEKPVAFLLALREGEARYDSENYRWFSQHYEKFLYIDRIVIEEGYRKFGIGRKLYDAVFSHAKMSGVPFVTAEIDTKPYNETSLKFHANMGFHEVGTQSVRGGSIEVSLQEAKVVR